MLLTAKNGNSLTVERAVQGQARSWDAGTEVARLFTAADLQAVQDNITALAEGKAELVHSHSQYLTAESDPTVPAWAKEETKPSYTATEVGAAAAEHTHSQYLTVESDPTVPSWAKQPAKPSYTASEVGADAAGTASSAVATHNTAADAHADLFAAKADSSHNQAASTITAGTLGGQVIANSAGQTPSASLLRNSKLVSTETAPTVNGEICWTYE